VIHSVTAYLTPADHAMSPRSIHAFSTYFARNVLVAQYSIPDELHQAVVTLTLSTVFRRLHPYVFVYKPAALRKQDIRWRHKVSCDRSSANVL
jgi:hypothetical protein